MQKKKFDLSHIPKKDEKLQPDQLNIFMMDNGNIRGAVCRTSIMVNEMRGAHELGIIETLVLGHAYTGTALLTIDMKGNERIVLQVDGSGPLEGYVAEANARGEVRGYLKQKSITIDKPVEKFDLAPYIGIGFLKITKYIETRSQPFTGQVVLETSNLAEDLTHYFLSSEQIHSAFNISVKFNKEGLVTGAGGIFLQAMPGAQEDTLENLEKSIKSLPSLGKLYEECTGPEEIISRHFSAFNPTILDCRPVAFICHCDKQRFRQFLTSLPENELKDIRNTGPFPLSITCHNCNSVYSFSKTEIESLKP